MSTQQPGSYYGTVGSPISMQPENLFDWMVRLDLNVSPPLAVSRIGIGQSNITSLVVDITGAEWVLREPPSGAVGRSTHDLVREAGILRALAATAVPVPQVLGVGKNNDDSPFLLMERVPGAPLETAGEAARLNESQRYELGVSVAQTLAQLHMLDPLVLGVRPSRTSYLARQFRRLTAARERISIPSSHSAAWRVVRDDLSDRHPRTPPPVVMHGDYRLSNLLIDRGRISAVLDWELCTIGDPLADLAWLLDDWRPADEPAIVMPSPTRAGGFPDRTEMISVYQQITGFKMDTLDYYRAFSQWRAASLLEGVRARRLSGAMGSHASIDPEYLEHSIGILLSSAANHLRRGG